MLQQKVYDYNACPYLMQWTSSHITALAFGDLRGLLSLKKGMSMNNYFFITCKLSFVRISSYANYHSFYRALP